MPWFKAACVARRVAPTKGTREKLKLAAEIKREAERWQGLLGNVDVYAVDLYDGQVATDQARASKLSSSLNKKRAENIIKGVLAASGKDKRVATLGWCMGGTWSLNAALLAGDARRDLVRSTDSGLAGEMRVRMLEHLELGVGAVVGVVEDRAAAGDGQGGARIDDRLRRAGGPHPRVELRPRHAPGVLPRLRLQCRDRPVLYLHNYLHTLPNNRGVP